MLPVRRRRLPAGLRRTAARRRRRTRRDHRVCCHDPVWSLRENPAGGKAGRSMVRSDHTTGGEGVGSVTSPVGRRSTVTATILAASAAGSSDEDVADPLAAARRHRPPSRWPCRAVIGGRRVGGVRRRLAGTGRRRRHAGPRLDARRRVANRTRRWRSHRGTTSRWQARPLPSPRHCRMRRRAARFSSTMSSACSPASSKTIATRSTGPLEVAGRSVSTKIYAVQWAPSETVSAVAPRLHRCRSRSMRRPPTPWSGARGDHRPRAVMAARPFHRSDRPHRR